MRVSERRYRLLSLFFVLAHLRTRSLGSLRSYDGKCNENVTLKLNFALSKKWMKDLLLQARVVVRTSNMKILRRRLADYVKTLHQKACCTCSTIIFLHSTNQIIDLWRCRWRCRRQILNSLLIKGSLSKVDGNGNDNTRKQWSDWLNEETIIVQHVQHAF